MAIPPKVDPSLELSSVVSFAAGTNIMVISPWHHLQRVLSVSWASVLSSD